MVPPRQAYWNAEFETMAADALRAIEEDRLRRQLTVTAAGSPFYRQKWESAGADPMRVRRIEDLTRLPFTEKHELQETQESHPPFGDNQCVPLDRLVRMQATGGT